MKRIPAVYFHGGPGLNANPERNILAPLWPSIDSSAFDWNEPSRLRPDGPGFLEANAFQHYLECAEKHFLARAKDGPVVLMGHSFGSFPVVFLAKRYPQHCRFVVIVASDLAIEAADRNMFDFTLSDFKKTDPPKHAEMRQVVAAYTGKFDANTEAGFMLFLQNPHAFGHYWTQPEMMARYFECMPAGKYGVDVESFMAVRRSLDFSLLLPQQKSQVKAVSFFGEQEYVVSPVHERQIIDSHFVHHQTYDVPAAGHYVHFEQPDFVRETIFSHLES